MEDENSQSGSRWFPLTATETELILGVGAFAAASLAYLGIRGPLLAYGSVGFLVVAYLAGLVVHSRYPVRDLGFVPNGGLTGAGYVELFRPASESLLLMHVDDDRPNEELLSLYGSLLSRGKQIRRIIVLRPGHDAHAIRWITEFGDHPNLHQRIIVANKDLVVPLSFGIVDEHVVVLAVPGFHSAETPHYSDRMILRHLLILKRKEVTRAFLEVHERLWLQGRHVTSEELSALLGRFSSPRAA